MATSIVRRVGRLVSWDDEVETNRRRRAIRLVPGPLRTGTAIRVVANRRDASPKRKEQ
jgi:hypothetical protein